LAVSIDSLGYYEYSKQLYLDLSLEMSSITEAFYKQQGKRRAADQAYGNKSERRTAKVSEYKKEWQK
jgi:hypothetical protein